MSEKTQKQGLCLCGAVHITASAASHSVGACHCSMCRRWGGGPLMAIDCGADVAFEGEENIGVFDSSAWAERGFCTKCGTHLFYRIKETRQHIVPAGLFDNEQGIVFDHQVFTDEMPSFYRFANKTEDMTGAEVFAQFSPPD